MPYVGVKLANCFPDEPAMLASRRMAEDGGEALKAYVKQNTPIDKGELRGSWYRKPTNRVRTPFGIEYRSLVATNVDYAPFVEHGTGLWGPEHKKYLIAPKKPGGMLHWVDRLTGQHRFARFVMHPGSPGQYMMASGLAKTEATYALILAPALERWASAQEAAFAAGQLKGLAL